MKTFRNIFATLGLIGFCVGCYEYVPHAIIIGLIMIFGALAIDINETKN